ncbi:SufD family Fe-S cluster assembly protein [Candidatus Uhrbacteria bacterium]|nr:SufD family Fe-S cluster assembly protein [Candidatus Uhrbacteria bacterium]
MKIAGPPASITLKKETKVERDSASAFFSAAAFSSFWRLSIPAGTHIKGPLHITVAPEDFLIVDIGEGAEVTLVEEVTKNKKLKTKNSSHAVDLRLGERTKVAYISLSDASQDSIVRHAATVGREASMHWYLATLGGDNVDHVLQSEVVGEGGESGVDWLFFASGKEKMNLSVRNIFSAREGRGEVVMKGIAQDKAHAAANGIIMIGPQGTGTDTYLTQSVLMLDATAKVDYVPALQIKTNDVKASHSASVARVSPEDLFYFASRGIPAAEARRMFVEGFLGEVVQRFPDKNAGKTVMDGLRDAYISG